MACSSACRVWGFSALRCTRAVAPSSWICTDTGPISAGLSCNWACSTPSRTKVTTWVLICGPNSALPGGAGSRASAVGRAAAAMAGGAGAIPKVAGSGSPSLPGAAGSTARRPPSPASTAEPASWRAKSLLVASLARVFCRSWAGWDGAAGPAAAPATAPLSDTGYGSIAPPMRAGSEPGRPRAAAEGPSPGAASDDPGRVAGSRTACAVRNWASNAPRLPGDRALPASASASSVSLSASTSSAPAALPSGSSRGAASAISPVAAPGTAGAVAAMRAARWSRAASSARSAGAVPGGRAGRPAFGPGLAAWSSARAKLSDVVSSAGASGRCEPAGGAGGAAPGPVACGAGVGGSMVSMGVVPWISVPGVSA